jgi:hypothetical protein
MTDMISPTELQAGLSNRQKKFIRNTLAQMGLGSLREYYLSDHWRALRARYHRSKLPQKCIVCFDPNVDLHHRTYKRLGDEKLTDLVPLCREHHADTHALDQKQRNLWTASRTVEKSAAATRTV